MLVMHGAAWLAFKADGVVADRAASIGVKAALAAAVLFALGGVLIWLGLFGGYQVTSPIVWDGPSNPLGKTVVVDSGAPGCRTSTPRRGCGSCRRSASVAPLLAAIGFGARKAGLTFLASQARRRLHHRDGRAGDVPDHPAVEHASGRLADRVRRLVEPRRRCATC